MGASLILEETEIEPTSRDRAKSLALDAVLGKIMDEPERHGKAYKVARYEKRSSASGAKTSLEGRYGKDATAAGWTFGVHADDDKAYEGQFILIVKYTPDAVVEGVLAKHQAEFKATEAEKAARYKATKEKKAAEAKSAEGAGDLTSGGTGAATVDAPAAPAAPAATPPNPTADATAAAKERVKAARKAS